MGKKVRGKLIVNGANLGTAELDTDTGNIEAGPHIARENEHERLMRLMDERRFCAFIPPDGYVEGHGFRVSIVIENEPGHFPTGDDNWRAGRGKQPWFWGHDYDEAKAVALEYNRTRFHLTAKDCADIVTSSMAAGLRGRHLEHARADE